MGIDRLAYDGDTKPILERACNVYELGELETYELIEVGFEDYNVKIYASKGNVVAKIFSKQRNEAEIHRNVAILKALDSSDVSHPRLHHQSNGEIYYADPSGLGMVVMDYIDGATFYETRGVPTSQQLKLIASEAVKINKLNIEPEFIFDKWAIPNIHWMYEKVKSEIPANMVNILENVLKHYDKIDTKMLPTCFVHGDIIKTNVIMGEDEKPYIIDFSVSNIYPRVQEVAVMAANLMADNNTTLESRVKASIAAYLNAGGELNDYEQGAAYDYSLAGVAIEYMGSIYERIYNNEEGDEVDYWYSLAEHTLIEAA